jgi:hypothetical protein
MYWRTNEMDKKKEIVSLNAEVANFDLEEVSIEELEHRLELVIGSSVDQTPISCDSYSTGGGGGTPAPSGWS